jgi:hypothetical protein
MPRIFVDTGFDAFNIDMQEDDAGEKMLVKIVSSDGIVYSGELVKQSNELLSPPDNIEPK